MRRRWVLLLSIVGIVLVMLCTACSDGAAPTQVAPTSTVVALVRATQVPTRALHATQMPTHAVLHPTQAPTHVAAQATKPAPTQPPAPTPCANPCNPWGYNFSPGNYITSPPASFCSYFACIASFWNGAGYVMECQDTMYSKSGGVRGSCSQHGGDLRALYSH